MPIVTSNFIPAWWLQNPHLQTIWPTFFRRHISINYKITSERLELNDGDFLDLDWSGSRDGKLILVLHGLEGNRTSPYIKGILNTLTQSNYTCCLMHFRGCSGEPNRLPRSYHSGETGDLQQVINHIQQHHQRSVYAVVGFSLGGNVLLKWLGEKGHNAPVTKAVAVSVPFSLDDAARRMGTGLSRGYEHYLVTKLQKKYREKFSQIQSPLKINVDHLNTFYLFDDQVTAPLHGFSNVHDYYERSSCGQFLKAITIPTLILHARDDPFMWPESVPDKNELSQAVRLELSEKGGHVGFISGSVPCKPEYWLEQRIPEWLGSQNRLSR